MIGRSAAESARRNSAIKLSWVRMVEPRGLGKRNKADRELVGKRRTIRRYAETGRKGEPGRRNKGICNLRSPNWIVLVHLNEPVLI